MTRASHRQAWPRSWPGMRRRPGRRCSRCRTSTGASGVVGPDTALEPGDRRAPQRLVHGLNWGIGLSPGRWAGRAGHGPYLGRWLFAWLLRVLAWLAFKCGNPRPDIYVEFKLGLTRSALSSPINGTRYPRLARWFLFLWLPWFTLGAVAWGALASRLPRPMPPRGNAPPPARLHHR